MRRATLIWGVLGFAIAVPIIAAATSPLLQWRDPIYIVAGLAGVIGLAIMLVQPLLAVGALPGLAVAASRRLHRFVGLMLVLAVCVHVIGLWITSPPDVIDVLLFRSPAPFAIWGVLAMWTVFGAAFLAMVRLRLPLRIWRWGHTVMVSLAVVGTVVHAIQITGTMEGTTKTALTALVVAALIFAVHKRRLWATGGRPRHLS